MTAPYLPLAMIQLFWPPYRPLYTLLYRNVGAHELLRNEGAAGALHDSQYSGRRVRNYCCVRDRDIRTLYRRCLLHGIPGGWIADRMIGSQNAIWYGGIIIMCGHLLLAIPHDSTFFIGLIFVVAGTGLLKPNIGALVGQLYPTGDERRDSGYTLYYMGINIGSIIGYLVCGWLQINVGYHWAFGAAAIGMGAGLIQFRLSLSKLHGHGANPTIKLSPPGMRRTQLALLTALALTAGLTYLIMSGSVAVDPVSLAQYVALLITAVFLGYYAAIYLFTDLTDAEKKSLSALFLVCVASTFFWAGFEQAGSSLNLFGRIILIASSAVSKYHPPGSNPPIPFYCYCCRLFLRHCGSTSPSECSTRPMGSSAQLA